MRTQTILKLTYGLVPIVAGLDKFTNLLTDWQAYVAPGIAETLPFSVATFLKIVGIIEIVAGLMVLSRWTRVGAFVVGAWLVSIAVQLVLAGHYDIAVRDVVMAIGAYSLAQLSAAREAQGAATPWWTSTSSPPTIAPSTISTQPS